MVMTATLPCLQSRVSLPKEGPWQELISPRGLRVRWERSLSGPRWARGCFLLRPPTPDPSLLWA